MTPVVSVPVLSKATVPHVRTASKTFALLTKISLQRKNCSRINNLQFPGSSVMHSILHPYKAIGTSTATFHRHTSKAAALASSRQLTNALTQRSVPTAG